MKKVKCCEYFLDAQYVKDYSWWVKTSCAVNCTGGHAPHEIRCRTYRYSACHQDFTSAWWVKLWLHRGWSHRRWNMQLPGKTRGHLVHPVLLLAQMSYLLFLFTWAGLALQRPQPQNSESDSVPDLMNGSLCLPTDTGTSRKHWGATLWAAEPGLYSHVNLDVIWKSVHVDNEGTLIATRAVQDKHVVGRQQQGLVRSLRVNTEGLVFRWTKCNQACHLNKCCWMINSPKSYCGQRWSCLEAVFK